MDLAAERGGFYLDLARLLLDLGIADRAILFDDHGPAAVALAYAGPAVVLAEEGFGVGHEELRGYK